jgi:hypothetical protein
MLIQQLFTDSVFELLPGVFIMKRTVIAAGVLTAMFLSSLAHAEEMQAEVYEHLKPLEWLIGKWVSESTNSDGAKQTVTAVWEWTPRKAAIRLEFDIEVAGKVTLNGSGITGWDAAAEAPKYLLFLSNGSRADFSVSKLGEKRLTQKGMVLSPEGEKTDMSISMELVDDNTLVNKISDGNVTEFKRVKK